MSRLVTFRGSPLLYMVPSSCTTQSKKLTGRYRGCRGNTKIVNQGDPMGTVGAVRCRPQPGGRTPPVEACEDLICHRRDYADILYTSHAGKKTTPPPAEQTASPQPPARTTRVFRRILPRPDQRYSVALQAPKSANVRTCGVPAALRPCSSEPPPPCSWRTATSPAPARRRGRES